MSIHTNTVRRWLRTVAVIIGALVLYLSAAIVATGISDSPMIGAVVSNAVLFIAGLFWLHSKQHRSTSEIPVRQFSHLAQRKSFWALTLITMIFCWLVGQATSLWLYALVGSENFDEHNTSMAEAPVVLTLVAVLILAPMGEEMLMRGVVYSQLRKHLTPVLAAMLSTGIFSLLHLNLVQIAVTLPLGLLLAAVYEHTGRLVPVILLHVGFNVLSVITPVSLVAGFASLTFVMLGGVVLALLLVRLYQKVSTTAVQVQGSSGSRVSN